MEDTSLAQVRRISRPIMILLSIALGLIVLVQIPQIFALLFLFHGGSWHAAVSASSTGVNLAVFADPDRSPEVALEALSLGQRSLLALLAALCAASGGLAIFHLRQLFALYAKGVIFAESNIRHIKRFGLWLAASAIVVNGVAVAFVFITGHPSHGTANAAMAVLFGAMTWVVARVMELGRQADQERSEFV